ncbi:MAG: SIMPL domain-containing protein [Solirubrobacteraceae bacterium]
MRIAFAAAGIAATGLVAAGVIVIAAEAETTSTSSPPVSAPLRTVGVQGVATEPVTSTASAEAATTVYRQAMAAAIADGQAKAQFLAEKAGATLGPVQSIGEGGGYISCPEGVEYQGGQPDFGSAASGGPVFAGAVRAPSAAKGGATPTVHRAPAKHHRKRRSARKAAVESCTLSTQVALSYQLG